MITCEHVSFKYTDTSPEVLTDVSFDVGDGEFVALLGHNGSGKSTLAKLFAAFSVPTSGRILVDGMDVADEDKIFDVRRACGTVFQNPDNQIVAGIVEEDVAFGLENLGVPTDQMRERVDEALKSVGMYEFRRHAPNLLSGGQKQRVAIAGVIAMRPKAIVFDEPTAMLDPEGRSEVMRTIEKLNSEGMTVVLITHHMDEAMRAQRVIVLNKGGVMMDGAPVDIFTRVNELKSVGLTVPATVQLMYELNQNGFSLPLRAIGVDECARELVKAVTGK